MPRTELRSELRDYRASYRATLRTTGLQTALPSYEQDYAFSRAIDRTTHRATGLQIGSEFRCRSPAGQGARKSKASLALQERALAVFEARGTPDYHFGAKAP